MAEDKICPFTMEKTVPSICIGEKCMAWRISWVKPFDPHAELRHLDPGGLHMSMRLDPPPPSYPDPKKTFWNCVRLAELAKGLPDAVRNEKDRFRL